MTTSDQVGEKRKFTTSPRVQAWFLKRSRDLWKTKYAELKADAKRLGNRVRDVGRSRDKRTEENKALKKRVAELEAEKTALHEQMAAFKKDGLLGAVGFALRAVSRNARLRGRHHLPVFAFGPRRRVAARGIARAGDAVGGVRLVHRHPALDDGPAVADAAGSRDADDAAGAGRRLGRPSAF